MARHKVEISGVNTANIKVLTSEEMTELFLKLKQGDPFAREELVQGNLKLVLSILKRFINRTDNMDDLFQVGCIGLLKAVDNFDLSHNVKFSTYAVPMILGEVRRYLRDNNALRISRSLKDTAYKALRLKEEMTNRDDREPSLDEVAQELGLPLFDVLVALEAMREPMSMFEPIYNDGGDTIYLFDQIEDKKEGSHDWDIKISLDRALKRLKERERYILNARYVIGKTQMEIAEEIGISQAQVSRLENNAIESIKKMVK
ncbi:MAG: RNA polymerase sporulation sigma factor SigG [Bacilli bacterium]|nr:RNA polymerase sporulation sigma factor SigG [Bacilli bacterium]